MLHIMSRCPIRDLKQNEYFSVKICSTYSGQIWSSVGTNGQAQIWTQSPDLERFDTLNRIEFLSFCFGQSKDESRSLIWSMSVYFIYILVGQRFLSDSNFCRSAIFCWLAILVIQLRRRTDDYLQTIVHNISKQQVSLIMIKIEFLVFKLP